jgi:hypothetical protein
VSEKHLFSSIAHVLDVCTYSVEYVEWVVVEIDPATHTRTHTHRVNQRLKEY